ncbi:unnamed protein product, partial [Brachionus calyciflorus]
GNAICKYDNCAVTYCISVQEKPHCDSFFVPVKIVRKNSHFHAKSTEKKEQIRGQERIETAIDVLANYNGSACAYVDSIASTESKNLPTEEVIRKIISDYKGLENISNCWITNVIHAADAYEDSVVSNPKLSPKTESIINNEKFTADDNSDESENDEENNEIFKNNSIKEMSPFTRHFKKVKSDILKNIRVTNKNENNLYNDSFMEFLMENFSLMPFYGQDSYIEI